MRWMRIAPVVLVAAGGCFATKSDVRLLQEEVRTLRTAVVQADTARQSQGDSLARQVARSSDSLRALSARLASFQGSVSGQLYEIGRQVLTIEELTGQQQRRLQELRAAWETQAQQQPVQPPAAGSPDSTAAPAAPPSPGPAQLFILSLDQLRRGSYGAARAGFQQLLTQYPDFDDAAQAQLYIGESYAQEKNPAAADSVYQLVVTKYPQSAQAPTALYKRALLVRVEKPADARALLQRIVRDYPRSDEAQLAKDLLSSSK